MVSFAACVRRGFFVYLIDRYILKQIWLPALLAALVICVVVVAGGIQEQLSALMRDMPFLPLGVSDVGLISFYALPASVGFIVPVTFLIGVLLTAGRMAQHLEIVALQAAGISLKRFAMPIIVMGAILSGTCFWVLDQAQPWAYQRLAYLVGSDLPLRVTLEALPPRVMHEFGDWRVYIGEKEDGTLKDLMILKPDDEGKLEAFYAESARIAQNGEKNYLELSNGYLIPDDVQRKLTFAHLSQELPSASERYVPGAQQGMSLAELRAKEQSYATAYRDSQNINDARELRRYRMEIANRLSFPLMCFAVAFVAGPIGARTRRAGRSFTFASGFIIIAIYFTLRRSIEIPFDPFNMPSLPIFIAVGQLPNVLLSIVGSVLLARLDRI